jgi:transposase
MVTPAYFENIFISSRPLDFRKSFDGLCGEVHDYVGRNPLERSLFVFYNRRHDSIKMLLWDRDGYIIWYKRLEEGTFEFPSQNTQDASYEVSREALQLILSGVSLASVKMRKRYKIAQ